MKMVSYRSISELRNERVQCFKNEIFLHQGVANKVSDTFLTILLYRANSLLNLLPLAFVQRPGHRSCGGYTLEY